MVDPEAGETRIELEFQKIATTIHDDHTKTNASMPSNKTKNRVNDTAMLPCKRQVNVAATYFDQPSDTFAILSVVRQAHFFSAGARV